jgi:hypothetical protein
MIAGPGGRAPLAFFFASAIAARYERFACSRRIHSAYSCEGGLAWDVPPADFGGSPGLFVMVLDGSVADVGEVGDCCPWFGVTPALPWA